MRIHSADFIAGAAAARGVAIVIDVFRACSLQAHALARGADCVLPVEDVEEARALKRAHPDRKSTRLNSSHVSESRMPSSA